MNNQKKNSSKNKFSSNIDKNINNKVIDEFEDPTPQNIKLCNLEKTHKPEKIKLNELYDDQKNLRLKAFNLMKKNLPHKEELTKFSKLNLDHEPLNKNIQQTIYIPENLDNVQTKIKKIEDIKINNSSKFLYLIYLKRFKSR